MHRTLWLLIYANVRVLEGAQGTPLVRIPQGSLRGVTLRTRGGRQISGFLGIPYAAAPVGPLRFHKPLPPGSWEGERDASNPGPPCLQTNISSHGQVFGDEDCLYLNVYTHKVSNESKSPVLVYIHGGGFAEGYGHLYEPDYLMDRDIVLVTLNYRLGALGFLSMEDKELPGNNGLKDQVAALRWLQHNIAQFGGDPGAVTLSGESAGAASVHYHMLSQATRGLFHRGISLSGTALSPWAASGPGQAQAVARRLATHLGCNRHNTLDTVHCLRDMPGFNLVKVTEGLREWHMDPAVLFPPAVEPADTEDAFLTSDPWTLTSDVPWITGITSAEAAIKVLFFKNDDIVKLNNDFKMIGPLSLMFRETAEDPFHTALAIKKFYFIDRDITPDSFEELTKMYTDAWFLYPAKEAVRRHKGTKYFYYFDYRGADSVVPDCKGVSHLDDLQYLFPLKVLFKDLPSEDKKMSEKWIHFLTNFVIHGKPTLESTEVTWSESTHGSEYLHLNSSGFVMSENLLQERDHFWIDLPYRKKYSTQEQVSMKNDEL